MAARRSSPDRPETRFPVRICIAVPPEGLGKRLDAIYAWLDQNCGAAGWDRSPAPTASKISHAMAIYFTDATLAAAFVSRWCVGFQPQPLENGVFQIREDGPDKRIPAPAHSIPRSTAGYE